MLYTIPEASKQVGISKVTGYKWLKQDKALKKRLTIKNKIQYLSEDGVVRLRELVQVKDEPCKLESTKIDADISRVLDALTQLQVQDKQVICKLNEQVEFLQEQLREKDRQIERNQITINHSQHLLVQKEEKLLLLESKKKWNLLNLFKGS